MQFSEDIRSVTELKRNTKHLLQQVHQTKRPIVLTVNGKADAVLLDAEVYEKHVAAHNLSRLLRPAEEEVATGKMRPAREFLKAFKRARSLSR